MTKLSAFQQKAFIKLFELFKKKYYSLGRMRGTVSLKSFSAQEIEEIAGFLGTSAIQLERKGTVTLQQFEEKLATSSFAHLTLLELMETVLNEKLQTKAQLQRDKASADESFALQLELLLAKQPKWLQQIQQQEPDSRFIWQQQAQVLSELEQVAKALEQHLARNQFERLPLFAQRATGNPHAFDTNTLAGKLLIHAAFSLSEEEIAYPKTTEERVDLLATLKLVRDDLWNFVTVQGLLGYDEHGVHLVWQAAVTTASALNMPMRQLLTITRVQPAQGNKVYIVENSSVASTLMDAKRGAAIICTHGQLRMASWRLLDLLDADVELYYSGDLDPEGIRIAQNIVNRYGNRVKLWRMDEACYKIGMAEQLPEERLVKLQSVTILPAVVEQIQHYKKAAYQEAWIGLLIGDLE